MAVLPTVLLHLLALLTNIAIAEDCTNYMVLVNAKKNQCLDGLTKWVTCVNQFCQGTSVLNGISVIPAAVSYTKSCILNNCAAQYNTYMQCNAASPLVGSVFLVAVLALFAQFFSKEF